MTIALWILAYFAVGFLFVLCTKPSNDPYAWRLGVVPPVFLLFGWPYVLLVFGLVGAAKNLNSWLEGLFGALRRDK